MTESTDPERVKGCLVGRKYRKADQMELSSGARKFDALVVGSGVGSLSTAAFLARQGKRVGVFESHYTAGGLSHVFMRKGYEWDVGVHYIGRVHRPNEPLRLVFDYTTQNRLQWQHLGDIIDVIVLGDKRFKLKAGLQQFTQGLLAAFPDEQDALGNYFDLLAKGAELSQLFLDSKQQVARIEGNEEFLGKLSPLLDFTKMSATEVFHRLTRNQDLRAVLGGQWGNIGLPPHQVPFYTLAMLMLHYIEGGCYPVGGGATIAREMVHTICASGGEVYTNASVASILCDSQRCYGIRLRDGTELRSDVVVSGVGIPNTMNLLPQCSYQRMLKEQVLGEMEPSYGHLCLYVGFRKDTRELNLPSHNYWIYPHNQLEQAFDDFFANPKESLAVQFLSFPSAKDPLWPKRFPGRATAESVTFVPFDWFEEWKDTEWQKRGDEYEALKKGFAERLLAGMFEVEPQLESCVDYFELSTPLSTKHFVAHARGEIYGLSQGGERLKQQGLRATTPISGFYLTGQDTFVNGIGGALMSGVMTASAVLEKDCMADVMSAESSSFRVASRV